MNDKAYPLPKLPKLDPKLSIPYDSIRYIAGYAESTVQRFMTDYARQAVEADRAARPAMAPATTRTDDEREEDEYTIHRMGHLLAEIAVIIKGPERARHRHGYADLPALVMELMAFKQAILDPENQPRQFGMAHSVTPAPRVQLAASRANRIYIAGPMTGIADYNFPAFNAAAAALRGAGIHVENPADHGVVEDATWADYMHVDVCMLATCAAIFLLPGWSRSKGASLEAHIAHELGMKVLYAAGAENVDTPLVAQASECAELRQDNAQLQQAVRGLLATPADADAASFARWALGEPTP